MTYLQSRSAPATTVRDRENSLRKLGNAYLGYLEHFKDEPAQRRTIAAQGLAFYLDAAKLALDRGSVSYTSQVSSLAQMAEDKHALDTAFAAFLVADSSEKERYLINVDYADGLAHFRDPAADQYFTLAISARKPIDSVEAHSRFARYLQETGQKLRALEILDRFSKEELRIFFNIAFERQRLMHELKLDTTEVDADVAAIRGGLGNVPGMRLTPPAYE